MISRTAMNLINTYLIDKARILEYWLDLNIKI